ncbi:MAG TPA: hypothetical protein VIS74_00550, partial [Chthoniobacterales bacterium]
MEPDQFTELLRGDATLKYLGVFASQAFYYICAVLMLLIHVGFLAYEGGAARTKNVLATMMKNLMTVSVVGLGWYLIGWYIYNGFPLWPVGPALGPWTNPDTLSDALKPVFALTQASYPWSEALTPTKADEMTGVFCFAFALFAMTTASIMSGALIERIHVGAYYILSFILGTFVWTFAAAWGWNFFGWFTTKLGYHDFGCSMVVHGIAGCFTLGVLINLGPRIGKYVDGKPRPILPHNLGLTMIGLMLIYTGFFFFLSCCVIFLGGYAGITSIYGTPTTLSSIAMNTMMALAAGFAGAYFGSKGDPFFTASGGLAGIIAVSAGMDLYHPGIVAVVAFIVASIMPKVALFIEKIGIDDAVGAFAVHGFCGIIGALLPGILALLESLKPRA